MYTDEQFAADQAELAARLGRGGDNKTTVAAAAAVATSAVADLGHLLRGAAAVPMSDDAPAAGNPGLDPEGVMPYWTRRRRMLLDRDAPERVLTFQLVYGALLGELEDGTPLVELDPSGALVSMWADITWSEQNVQLLAYFLAEFWDFTGDGPRVVAFPDRIRRPFIDRLSELVARRDGKDA